MNWARSRRSRGSAEVARAAVLGTAVLGSALALAGGALQAAGPAAAGAPSYDRDVRPILADRCFACHGPDEKHRQAGLRLDIESDALRARRIIVPGRPDDSALVRRIRHSSPALRMPPESAGKPLTSQQVETLGRWIAAGARRQTHWSYAPVRSLPPPAVKDRSWPRGDIDRFLLARMEAAGVRPAPDADPVIWLRRATLDLTGLPPSPDEVDAFLADRGPGARERAIDRLLASPRFGERMATFWLDLVRYADTVGYHGDQEHHISPYRDYVIRAFNENLPFDRFTIEQLAGDLLPDPTETQLIASGYNRVLQTTHEGGAQDGEYRAKYLADRVRNLSAVWMGATVGCAECHNHKFDPYTQRDFYRLGAFFADLDELGAYRGPDASPTKRPPEIEVLAPYDRLEADRLRAEIGRLRSTAGSEAEVSRLEAALKAVEGRRRLTMISQAVTPRTVRVLPRGNWLDESGEVVEPGVPAFLPPSPPAGGRLTRLDLARWLTDPRQPQTSRVFANRIWRLFFGAGLCRSLEDTGAQGEAPTHPELLDFLAARFAHGWDVKRLVREIVLSRAYGQSSTATPAARERDPENRLFARQGSFRLPAEMIRDQALFVSGLLVEKLGGPPVRPYQPAGYYALLNFPKRDYKADTGPDQWRRAIYMHWQRQYLHPMLRAFDAPTREECTAERPSTSTPLAALTLLNDPTFVEAARALAARVLAPEGAATEERLRRAWRLVLAREPEPEEAAALEGLIRRSRDRYRSAPGEAHRLLKVGLSPVPSGIDAVELAAWTVAARALFNLSETITRP